MVAESVAMGLVGAAEAVAVAAADEEAPADADTPADTPGRAEAVGVAAVVVAAWVVGFEAAVEAAFVAGFADAGCGLVDLVDFAFFDELADFEEVAVALVTGAAMAGRLVPAALCQANATEPPAGTLCASTPSEA